MPAANPTPKTPGVSPSPRPPCCASSMDCVEWLRVFRMRYDRATEDGHLETIEALEYLFDALWDGYGGECSKRWCDLIGAPREDGRKVLNQEAPYEDLREWVLRHNADAHPAGATPRKRLHPKTMPDPQKPTGRRPPSGAATCSDLDKPEKCESCGKRVVCRTGCSICGRMVCHECLAAEDFDLHEEPVCEQCF